MAHQLTDEDLHQALQSCADEPVHIPGIVQPYGCLLAVNVETNKIGYASENVNDFFDHPAEQLLGTDARDLLGTEIWHGVRNASARNGIATQTITVGDFDLSGTMVAVQVHRSQDHLVIEIEPALATNLEGPDAVRTLSFLMAQVQNCESEQALFELTCELMQHLSGFDRTLIYRFDREFNGEVLAETKHGPLDSFMGLRFPHWDIPSQARDIMKKLPLRFIQDVEQVPVPILARAGSSPLDITLAPMRGVSPVHMQYLRNARITATMTLSIVIENELWGIISFHHPHPKIPAPALRDVLISFLQIFSGKLLALRQKSALTQIERLDFGFMNDSTSKNPADLLIPSSTPVILEVFEAHGIASLSRSGNITSGATPENAVLQLLADLALKSKDIVVIESLAEQFPDLLDKLGSVAGALIVSLMPDRAICIFRNEIAREVAWAGNPEKTIEKHDGQLTLSPRGSFSSFLELVRGKCEPWSDSDVYLVGHLRTLLHAADRQTTMDTLNRQQELMIGELNHRVRNILALVRSVSRQARRRYGSLDSYANAIENRIRALAAAHDISGGRSAVAVPLHDLVTLEFEPFGSIGDRQVRIEGENPLMRPAVAPIFSLVIHELTTNAAKYGALSEMEGRVMVTCTQKEDSFWIEWQEHGGPATQRPKEIGFGMAMIERAVPHELGGTATVRFEPEGICVEFSLPDHHFATDVTSPKTTNFRPIQPERIEELPEWLGMVSTLVLEDNFIIAKEMADQLREIGCRDVRTASNAKDALGIIEAERIGLAILDVNLGPDQTSEAVAQQLEMRNIPFVFVTGYGEKLPFKEAFDTAPRVTKPISTTEFLQALSGLKPK